MTTTELQIDLINQIKGITNNGRLKELLQLVHFHIDNAVYVTNDEEKRAVAEARMQIENGEVISNSEIQAEVAAWLTK